jgi:hypothetical protein
MNRQRWVHVVTAGLACGAMAAAVMGGLGAPTVWADPAADPSAQSDAPPVMTADEALAIIDRDYDIGAGGGQLSTLIHDVMKLRALGFKPSNTNKEAITKALDYRPNQAPLIQALQETLSYQRKMQALRRTRTTRRNRGSASAGRRRAWARRWRRAFRLIRVPARVSASCFRRASLPSWSTKNC